MAHAYVATNVDTHVYTLFYTHAHMHTRACARVRTHACTHAHIPKRSEGYLYMDIYKHADASVTGDGPLLGWHISY